MVGVNVGAKVGRNTGEIVEALLTLLNPFVAIFWTTFIFPVHESVQLCIILFWLETRRRTPRLFIYCLTEANERLRALTIDQRHVDAKDLK